MKYFKFLLINIVAFSSLFFLISLLFPNRLVTSKTVSIRGTKEKIKEKILLTENWKEWNSFIKDNDVEKQNWSNMDTMIFSVENKNHEIFLSRFIFYTEQTNSVLLNWDLVEKLPWYKPWKKFKAMVLSKEVAAVMDSSLNNFKVQAEAGK